MNEAGYRTSSVLPYAGQLTGKLLLVQGLVDENVLFPEARHMPRNPAHLEYLERQLVEFLHRNL